MHVSALCPLLSTVSLRARSTRKIGGSVQGPHFSRTRIRPDLPPQTRPLTDTVRRLLVRTSSRPRPMTPFPAPSSICASSSCSGRTDSSSHLWTCRAADTVDRRQDVCCGLDASVVNASGAGAAKTTAQGWTLHVERRTMESETARIFQTLVRHKDTSPHAPIWLVCKYTCYASTGRDALQGMRRSCNGRACSNVLEPAGEKDDGDSKDSGDSLRCMCRSDCSPQHGASNIPPPSRNRPRRPRRLASLDTTILAAGARDSSVARTGCWRSVREGAYVNNQVLTRARPNGGKTRRGGDGFAVRVRGRLDRPGALVTPSEPPPLELCLNL